MGWAVRATAKSEISFGRALFSGLAPSCVQVRKRRSIRYSERRAANSRYSPPERPFPEACFAVRPRLVQSKGDRISKARLLALPAWLFSYRAFGPTIPKLPSKSEGWKMGYPTRINRESIRSFNRFQYETLRGLLQIFRSVISFYRLEWRVNYWKIDIRKHFRVEELLNNYHSLFPEDPLNSFQISVFFTKLHFPN